MASYQFEDWRRLVGAVVEIRNAGQLVRTGLVDAAMPDSSGIWLAASGVDRRTLYGRSMGYRVWIEPRQLLGALTRPRPSLRAPRKRWEASDPSPIPILVPVAQELPGPRTAVIHAPT